MNPATPSSSAAGVMKNNAVSMFLPPILHNNQGSNTPFPHIVPNPGVQVCSRLNKNNIYFLLLPILLHYKLTRNWCSNIRSISGLAYYATLYSRNPGKSIPIQKHSFYFPP
jgi:hypothetical protein